LRTCRSTLAGKQVNEIYFLKVVHKSNSPKYAVTPNFMDASSHAMLLCKACMQQSPRRASLKPSGEGVKFTQAPKMIGIWIGD
jgi:hypothetical protein